VSPTKTSAAPRPTSEPGLEDAAWTVEALGSVWEHQQSRVRARIEAIERAVAALGEDRLSADLRADAVRVAHMLAGSIGMFGFIDASEAARELESELVRATPDCAPMLSALLTRLRGGIQGPVTLCSEEGADQWTREGSRTSPRGTEHRGRAQYPMASGEWCLGALSPSEARPSTSTLRPGRVV
jgi:HPt (histidine-containing phosphotransfer) domain-containing protein